MELAREKLAGMGIGVRQEERVAQPVRTCIGCGARRDKAELVRLVASAGQVVVDGEQRATGRGAYVCDVRCAEKAVGRKALNRALRGRAQGDDGLARRVAAWQGRGDEVAAGRQAGPGRGAAVDRGARKI